MADNINVSIKIDERIAEVVKLVDQLVGSLDTLKTKTDQITRVSAQSVKAHTSVARATKQATSSVEIFNKASTDLTKSVQVALGPLSGVAARITAMTSLFNRNSFAAAAVIGSITGLGVATRKLTRFAMETEVELLRMEAVVASLGETANFTSRELEHMSQKLTQSTLASVSEAREAITTLATFGNIAPEVFQRATQAAYAFADVMGGQLAASVRQVGVLLEDPVRNMEMLRRRGIQFTQSEREKIDVLMKSGRVMEAQNMTLDKFNIFMAQSSEKAKLLAGSLDRTAQLFNNFAQKVSAAGNLTGGVNTQIGKLNQAFEDLLKSEVFIQKWGNLFAGVASIVSGTLRLLTERIEAVTVAVLAFLVIITTRSAIALAGFIVKLIGASKALSAVSIMAISAKTSVLLAIPALMKFGGVFAFLTGPIGLFAAALGGALYIVSRWKSDMKEMERVTAPIKEEFKEINEKIKDLPDHIKIGFEIETDKLVSELGRAKIELAKLELAAAKAQATIERGRSRISPFGARQRSLTPAERATQEERIRAYETQLEIVREIEEKVEQLKRDAETGAIAGRLFGTPDVAAAIKNLRDLEETLDSGVAADRRRSESLTVLWNVLESIIMQTNVGFAFLKAGITEDYVVRLIDLVNTGTTSVKKADDAWKGLANTFSDVEFSVKNLIDEFSGIDTSLRVSPSLMRQWEALTSGDRSKLTGMGVTPESITSLQKLQNDLNDLTKYRQKIIDEQLSASEKITKEAERMLSILESTAGISQEILEIERNRIQEYAKGEVAKIIKEEQRARWQAVREIENMYAYMNMTIKESVLSERDFAIENLKEQLRQQIHAVQEYVNKRVELEKGMNDAIAADQARLVAGFIRRYEIELERVKDQHDTMRKIAAGAAKAMQTSFAEFLFKPWEEGLQGMLRSFVMTLHKMVSEILAQQLLMAFFKSMGGTMGGGNIASTFLRAVAPVGAAQGGYVSGPGTSTSDSIPARLSSGEYVINARAVRQIGINALHAINEGRIAKFNQGGYVGNQTEAGTSGVRIINVIDPALVQDYMSSPGGEKVVLNILQKNAGSVRQMIA